MKLTKQGVRDLGGNNVRRTEPRRRQEREYAVDCGEEYGSSGIVLHIKADSVRSAIREARRILAQTYAAQHLEVIQVHDGRDIVWDYVNGRL